MAGEALTFNAWMDRVNRTVESLAGVSALDLTDQPYRDWYNDGIPSIEAAEMALEDNGMSVE